METLRSYIDNLNLRADRVGDGTLRTIQGFIRFYYLSWAVIVQAFRMQWISRPAVVNVVIRQIYFTGVQGLPWILFFALGAGAIAVYNIASLAKHIQDLSLVGTLLNWLLVQELAPFMVAIFLLSRSGVAIVTEVGNIHVRGEDGFLRSIGIHPYEYIYLPRILAFAVCGLILTFIFVALSVWVGALLLAWSQTLNFPEFLLEFQRGATLEMVVVMMVKGLCYPMLSCMLLIDQACRVGRDPNQIPIRATNGFLGALILMVVLDVVWAVLRSLM